MRGYMSDNALLFEGTRGINLPVFPSYDNDLRITPVQSALANWISQVMIVNEQPDEYYNRGETHPYHEPSQIIMPPQEGHPFRLIHSVETTKLLGLDVNLDFAQVRSLGASTLKTEKRQVLSIDALPEGAAEDYTHLFKYVETTRPGYHGVHATLNGEPLPLKNDFDTDRAVRKHNKQILPAVEAILASLGYTDEAAKGATLTYFGHRMRLSEARVQAV